ncbi:MAG TPA: hypothetical protein VK196_11740 [Magnetospirillum sp.]|nr:hypothetical protein [Magnetospirillum sp.]
MALFQHHPDGIIYMRGECGAYAASLAEFLADLETCGLPPYAGLPDGYRERRYLPGVLHALYTADSQDGGGQWGEGDAYIAAIAELSAAAACRLAVSP